MDIVIELACSVHQYYTDNPIKTGDRKSPLHFAAMTGQMEIFETMFERVQDKNPKDNVGGIPLHWAARNGHLAICQYIIERELFQIELKLKLKSSMVKAQTLL